MTDFESFESDESPLRPSRKLSLPGPPARTTIEKVYSRLEQKKLPVKWSGEEVKRPKETVQNLGVPTLLLSRFWDFASHHSWGFGMGSI